MQVTCLYCRQKLEKEEGVRVGTRYVHKECVEKREQKEASAEKKTLIPTVPKKNLKICYYCKKEINIVEEPYKKPRINRYAHLKCYELNYTEDELYIDKIYSFLKSIGIKVDYALCERQRNHFIKDFGYNNEGILLALKYFYEVKKSSPDKSGNRIGIVPYVYEEAQSYYSNLNKKQKKIAKDVKEQLKIVPITIQIKGSEEKASKNYIDIDNII